jgi:hypothetical protein
MMDASESEKREARERLDAQYKASHMPSWLRPFYLLFVEFRMAGRRGAKGEPPKSEWFDAGAKKP